MGPNIYFNSCVLPVSAITGLLAFGLDSGLILNIYPQTFHCHTLGGSCVDCRQTVVTNGVSQSTVKYTTELVSRNI